MDKEKFFGECNSIFCSAVSRKIENGRSGGTLIIDYDARPVCGELARILYEFALALGYEPRFCERARFNSSGEYTFVIENDGGAVDYISVVRETPMTRRAIERWCRCHAQKRRRRSHEKK